MELLSQKESEATDFECSQPFQIRDYERVPREENIQDVARLYITKLWDTMSRSNANLN